MTNYHMIIHRGLSCEIQSRELKILQTEQYQDYVILVMEFCEGGNLASFIRLHGRVQQCLAKRFMQQLGKILFNR